ncbi:MAG: isoaspartyl peptidase/L-asparaginase [Saprospiraceae bacterium]
MPEETVSNPATEAHQEPVEYALVIHGGAGTILPENMTPETEAEYKDILNKALDAGETVLKDGGTAADAVVATIMIMENSPLFNSGKGAVFTHDGRNELDASFMEGANLNAGAVGGVTNVKNPILAARAVMENSPHVLLTGKGAEQFAAEQGLEIVDPSYFYTERRWNSLQEALKEEKESMSYNGENPDYKYGTVGCVALDQDGNIVAGTSTGGMTNKRWNRIGDSPIIGAGTYANNNTCGVSCTGHGEFFIRYAVAHDLSAMMEYKGIGIEEAADNIINDKLLKAGGSGGFVALDKYGHVAMPFNTPGMYRGYAKPGERVVKIYKE